MAFGAMAFFKAVCPTVGLENLEVYERAAITFLSTSFIILSRSGVVELLLLLDKKWTNLAASLTNLLRPNY